MGATGRFRGSEKRAAYFNASSPLGVVYVAIHFIFAWPSGGSYSKVTTAQFLETALCGRLLCCERYSQQILLHLAPSCCTLLDFAVLFGSCSFCVRQDEPVSELAAQLVAAATFC